ncbi:MAG: type II secretion system F family protein [Candidatus Omnitrophota bacterium]|nr:type II secretion system F family protein [Candidatus Omnitrophota bacterium]
MAKYSYIARDKSGAKINGSEEGATQDEIINRLQAKGLVVVNILAESAGKEALAPAGSPAMVKVKSSPKHNRINNDDLTLFCRQLATLLGAGVTILKSLDIISLQVASKRLYLVIKDLEKNMEAGLSFHEAMAKHPKVFPELWIHLVESGEASGNLAVILSRLASYLERNAAFKKKIVSALIYPAILFMAGMSALLFMTIKIIPTFAEIFSGFNIKLPFLTLMLIYVSKFIRGYFLIIILGIGAGIWFFRKYTSTKAGKKKYEEFLLKLPVLGGFFHTLVIERFTSEMSTLVESGVPILYSLEIAERSVGNLVLGEIIRNIKEDVRAGKPLGLSLERSNFFDPMAVQMVTIGEEIGELSNMFKRLNAFYEEYLDTFLVRLTSMFEPFMLIFMGAVIGIMVIGMFLPIFEISQIGGK